METGGRSLRILAQTSAGLATRVREPNSQVAGTLDRWKQVTAVERGVAGLPTSGDLLRAVVPPRTICDDSRVDVPLDAVRALHEAERGPVALRLGEICGGEHHVIRAGFAQHAEFERPGTVRDHAAEVQHVQPQGDE